uniref:C2H2-type domain-containing protein n=1 Tax=Cyprinus carpio TaxID=7962 RepID=A0A8C1YEK6_CYPCA
MDVCKTSRSPERIHCKVCGKTFRLRAQLNAHLRSHSDEKPFKCDNCGKAFKYTWNLNKHKREQCSQKIVPQEKSSVPDKELNNTKKEDKESPLIVSSQKALRYKCTFCPAEFSSKSGFYSHLAKHKSLGHAKKAVKHKHGNAVNLKSSSSPGQRPTSQECADDTRLPHSCRFCGRAFASPDSLKKHLQLHKGNKPFRCLDCGKNFARHGHLMVHVRLHTGEKPYGCANCGEHFIRTDYLKRHLAKCNGKGENQEKNLCDKCGDLFTRDALSVHQKTCVISSKSSGSSQEVNDKDKSPPKIKGFSCANCSDRFLLFSQLQQHFLAKHRSDQPQESNNGQQQLVSSHMQVIKQEQVDEGNGQNQESSSQINTKELRACTNTDLIKPLKCPHCNMHFFKKAGLNQDQENDSEKDDVSIHKYQCSECDQSFTDGLRLISHLEQHGREDQERRSDIYRCHVCSKVFAQAGILQRKSPHRCTKCHLSFTRSTELAEHMVTHRDENFPCDLCDETFSCKTSRAEHRK